MRKRISEDTNTLISIPSRDKSVMELAADINRNLIALREARRRLQNGDLELKEAVTNISHDLRTPLSAILGYLELLEKKDNPAKSHEYIAIIKNRAEALKQMTEELFKYSVVLSSQDEMEPEMLSLNSALEEGLSACYTALTANGITPEISMPDKEVRRSLDKKVLSRVLCNIISNAAKYSEEDLKIVLDNNGRMVFTNKAPNLDNIQIGRLFDRFYTVESARRSTGLGLAIAKLLTERMNGSIYAGYENESLSITLYFPEK